MSAVIQSESIGYFTLSGRVSYSDAHDFLKDVSETVIPERDCVMDLSRLICSDSSIFSVLLAMLRSFELSGYELCFSGLSPELISMAELTGCKHIIAPFYDDGCRNLCATG